MIVAAAVFLFVVTTLDGRVVFINPAAITSIAEAKGEQLTDKAHCVVNLADGRFVTVAEKCASIRTRLRDKMSKP